MSNISLTVPQLGNRFYDYRKDCWGDSYTWDFERSLDQVKYLAIHHSVTPQIGSGKEQVDRIGQEHKANGWLGYGYHFVISSDGVAYYVGDIGTGRANVAKHNDVVIGICLIGDFTKHLPTDIQINTAHDLCDFFLFHYPDLKNVTDWETSVIGHKDAATIFNDPSITTACPGSSWPDDMKWRISTNTIYTPIVNPTPEPPISQPEPVSIGNSPISNPQLTECESKLSEVKSVLWGRGRIYERFSRLKVILPRG